MAKDYRCLDCRGEHCGDCVDQDCTCRWSRPRDEERAVELDDEYEQARA